MGGLGGKGVWLGSGRERERERGKEREGEERESGRGRVWEGKREVWMGSGGERERGGVVVSVCGRTLIVAVWWFSCSDPVKEYEVGKKQKGT